MDLGFVHLFLAILSIIICSIGIQAFNSNAEFKSTHQFQLWILIILLVAGLIATFATSYSLLVKNKSEIKGSFADNFKSR